MIFARAWMLVVALAFQAPDGKVPQAPPEKDEPKTEKPSTKIANKTPEEAMKSFFIAMLSKDREALESLTVPTEDLGWLLKGVDVPPLQLVLIKVEVGAMPIRVLKEGDEVPLLHGSYTVQPGDVGEDRAMVTFPASPLPLRLRKTDDRWRVDASPIIAGRKAADAARKKAEARAKEKEEKTDP